jgi:hypothetical protein
MRKADNFNSSKWLVENKITFQSRLNQNQTPGVDVEVDDDMITLSGDSGEYDGFIEDDGTVNFSVTNDEEEFNEQNWKDILGDNHVFVKVANAIPTKVEAMGDYVMITVKADDLTGINESRLNENTTLIPHEKIYNVLANEKITSADYNEIEKYLDVKKGNFDWEIKNALSKIYTQNKVDDIMNKIKNK